MLNKITNTPEELEMQLGEHIKSLRLLQNIDRSTLALRAGCSLSAIKNLENGAGSTLRTLVLVLKALGRDDWLHTVAPTSTISPLNLPKSGVQRQRARTPRFVQ